MIPLLSLYGRFPAPSVWLNSATISVVIIAIVVIVVAMIVTGRIRF